MSVSGAQSAAGIKDALTKTMVKLSPFQATVSSIIGDGSVLLIDSGAEDTTFDQPAWLLQSSEVFAGDLVVVLPMIDDMGAESYFVLDSVSDGTPPFDPTDVRTGGPVTATNNSITTYASLLSESFTFPAGVWTASCAVIANFANNTAASGATGRFSSPSVGAATNAETATANNLFSIVHAQTFTGLSGAVTFGYEYRARNGGTATAGRWDLIVLAKRTA